MRIKYIFIVLLALSLTGNSYAEDIGANISKKISDLISQMVPGEGYTESSIDLRENNSPDFSILAVRELDKTDDGNFFTQFSLYNTEKNNDERIVGNLGFGKRTLSEDKLMMTGFNGFLDLVTVTFVTRFGKKPMHFFGVLGSLMFMLGFSLFIYRIYIIYI